jgi:hypothetical protein
MHAFKVAVLSALVIPWGFDQFQKRFDSFQFIRKCADFDR